MKTQSGIGGSMTMAIPKPSLMSVISDKKLPTTNLTGKGGTTSGGVMSGCAACGSATKAIPTPKKM